MYYKDVITIYISWNYPLKLFIENKTNIYKQQSDEILQFYRLKNELCRRCAKFTHYYHIQVVFSLSPCWFTNFTTSSLIAHVHSMIHEEITFQSLRYKTHNVQILPALSDYKGTITHDNIGRVHLPAPHTAPVSLRLRATKYHPSTIATHINNLHNILKEEKKTACIILSDGGPDYSPSNVVNNLFYFKSWTLISSWYLHM